MSAGGRARTIATTLGRAAAWAPLALLAGMRSGANIAVASSREGSANAGIRSIVGYDADFDIAGGLWGSSRPVNITDSVVSAMTPTTTFAPTNR